MNTENIETRVCSNCKKALNIHTEMTDHNGFIVCEECFNLVSRMCDDCERIIAIDDCEEVQNSFDSDIHYVCDICRNNYINCYECGGRYHEDYMHEDNSGDFYCEHCQSAGNGNFEDEDSSDFEDVQRPRLDIRSNVFRSDDKGSIITDDRIFSAEIECYPNPKNTTKSLMEARQEINKNFKGTGEITDASLDNSGIEFQTPLLKGKKGQDYIENLLKMLKDKGFYVNKKAGTHIHLDGKGFSTDSLIDKEELLQNQALWFLRCGKSSKAFKEELDNLKHYTPIRYHVKAKIARDLALKSGMYFPYPEDSEGNFTTLIQQLDISTIKEDKRVEDYYYSDDRVVDEKLKQIDTTYLDIMKNYTKDQRLGEMEYRIQRCFSLLSDDEHKKAEAWSNDFISSKVLSRMKQLFTVYYFADDVIMQLLPHSRRNNKYCLPLWRDFNLTTIDGLESMTDFEKMWYKYDNLNEIKNKKNDPKDVSRRHGANFHILMCQGHFELRYHSGTLNSDKLLYWVQLNQSLMKLATEDQKFFAIREELERIRYIQNLKLRRLRLYSLLDLPDDAIKYWESRAKKFTDEETELSEVTHKVGVDQDL